MGQYVSGKVNVDVRGLVYVHEGEKERVRRDFSPLNNLYLEVGGM